MLSPRLDRSFEQFMSLGDLPSAPEITQLILSEMEAENLDVRGLASMIEHDRLLTAALLRLANSALFVHTCSVTTAAHAVTLLGLRRVRSLVLGLSLWDVFGAWRGKGRHLRPVLWEHAVTVGATAKCLAGRVGVSSVEAFTAGLLHDIGKAALGHRLGDDYWSLLEEAAARDADVVELELGALEYHHGLVAEWLLQFWHVPTALVAAVADHHDGDVAVGARDLAAVVAIADRLVEATEGTAGRAATPLTELLARLAPDLAGDAGPRLALDIAEAQRVARTTLTTVA